MSKLEEKEFYDTRELAKLLGVAEITVRRLVDRGDLPFYRVGRLKRFRRADVSSLGSQGLGFQRRWKVPSKVPSKVPPMPRSEYGAFGIFGDRGS